MVFSSFAVKANCARFQALSTKCSVETSLVSEARSVVVFLLEEMKGHDILCVAGGLGIAPLRSSD